MAVLTFSYPRRHNCQTPLLVADSTLVGLCFLLSQEEEEQQKEEEEPSPKSFRGGCTRRLIFDT